MRHIDLHVFDYGLSSYLFHTKMFTVSNAISVADPEYPVGRGAPTSEWIAPTYYFTIFYQKLHENEKNLGPTRGGGACAPSTPLDPPMHLLVGKRVN